MNDNEQGVLINNKLLNLLLIQILLSLFILTYSVITEASSVDEPTPVIDTQKSHVFVVHSPQNKLHLSIIESLKDELEDIRPDLIFMSVLPEEKITSLDINNDLVVIMGYQNIKNENRYKSFPKKLFLATAPLNFRLDTDKNNAVMYMTQPYCRQLNFIHAINNEWDTVSILSRPKLDTYRKKLEKCASELDLGLYIAKVSAENPISASIKDALNHSDLLLALPDKGIYNSRSVKNILLTSYRYRKPVIAFSGNFVKAGALASIHSSPEQIAKSVIKLINGYFKNGNRFTKAVNYPQLFDVSINRQVFKALGLPAPDIEKLKQNIVDKDPKESGH